MNQWIFLIFNVFPLFNAKLTEVIFDKVSSKFFANFIVLFFPPLLSSHVFFCFVFFLSNLSLVSIYKHADANRSLLHSIWCRDKVTKFFVFQTNIQEVWNNLNITWRGFCTIFKDSIIIIIYDWMKCSDNIICKVKSISALR